MVLVEGLEFLQEDKLCGGRPFKGFLNQKSSSKNIGLVPVDIHSVAYLSKEK